MKKSLMLLIFTLIPIILFSQTQEQQWLNNGNYYYKQKNFDKAVIAYDNVLKINPMNVYALVFGGNAYIHLNNVTKAIDYLEQAYKLTDNIKLKSQIDSLRLNYQNNLELAKAKKPEDSFFKWPLICTDALAIGVTVCMYIWDSDAYTEYESSYAACNNTTYFNYEELLSEKHDGECTVAPFVKTVFSEI
jgi:tetratricopeptide (TPR) repeat protein